MSVRPVHDTTKTRTTCFLAEPPRREKMSHRPPHTIVHALSKFELHWCLLRCVRMWEMLGPNLTRTCPTEAPRKFHFAHFSTNCRVNWTEVAPPSRPAEAFSGSVTNSSRGRERLYFFRPQTSRISAALIGAF